MSSSRTFQAVTVEGTGRSVLLGRGERMTVALTDVVQRRIDRGYLILVEPEVTDGG